MPTFVPSGVSFAFDNPVVTDQTIIEADLRARFGAKFASSSVAPWRVTVVLSEPPTQQEINDLRTYMTSGSIGLVVTCNKERIAADGVEVATITCTSPLFASDTVVDYIVRYTGIIDGVEYENDVWGSGEAAVEATSVVTLTLVTDAAGDYVVSIVRKNGRHRGSVTIEATEVA